MRPFAANPGSVHQLSEEAAWPRLGHLEPITVTRGWGLPVVHTRVTCPPLGWMGLAGSVVEGAQRMEGEGSWTRGSISADFLGAPVGHGCRCRRLKGLLCGAGPVGEARSQAASFPASLGSPRACRGDGNPPGPAAAGPKGE